MLSTAEIQQIKHWLGYSNLTAQARPYFNIALVFEEVVQQNLDQSFAEGYIRNTILPNLLSIDASIMSCGARFQIREAVGDAVLNPDKELSRWLDLKWYWVNELSMTLGIKVVPSINSVGSFEVM